MLSGACRRVTTVVGSSLHMGHRNRKIMVVSFRAAIVSSLFTAGAENAELGFLLSSINPAPQSLLRAGSFTSVRSLQRHGEIIPV